MSKKDVAQEPVSEGEKKLSKKDSFLGVEWVPIESLKPNWYNPNRQSEYEFELLLKSMKEDGFTQPILALKKDRMIVDGEHRWRAAQTLGYKEVPVVFTDMSIEQMMVSTLRHNRARGSEDAELVNRVLKDLKDLGAEDWVKDSLMISDDEMNLAFMKASASFHDAPSVQDLVKKGEIEVVEAMGGSKEDPYAPSIGQGAKLFITKDEDGNEVSASLSKEAADLVRKRGKEAKQEWNKEQREAASVEGVLRSFVFLYTPEQAEIVRPVLGKEPATKVLELSKKYAEEHPELQ